jgi:hypothetical protein
MKNTILTLAFIIVAFSCANKVNPKEDLKEVVKQETTPQIVGNDQDEHGCKASAGYTWSVLRKECIRVFEGTRLDHTEQDDKSYTTSAFVVFEEQGNKAELFLDTQKESIILERKSESQPWVKDDWQLISWKGYVLKKGKKIVYTGQ